MTTGPQRRRRAGDSGDGPVTEAPGRAARTPDSLLRGLVSTALTLARQPPKLLTQIVGIPRFLLGDRRRYGVNVSTVDTWLCGEWVRQGLGGAFRFFHLGGNPTGPCLAPSGARAGDSEVMVRR